RMLEPPERLGLAGEAPHRVIGSELRADHLERYGPPGLLLFRGVDGSHAARPQHAENAIAGDRRRMARAGRRELSSKSSGPLGTGFRHERISFWRRRTMEQI